MIYFLMVSFIVNFALFLLVVVMYLKIDKMTGDAGRHFRGDRRVSAKVAKKIEKVADLELQKISRASWEKLESAVNREVAKVVQNAATHTNNLAAFIQEQEKGVIRESQFLVANNLVKLQKDLAAYKENQLTKVDQEITSIVFEAAKEVLGRAISLPEHETLVNEALERAKKDKFFI